MALNTFERRLDKFWENQEIKYDFKKCLKITHANNALDVIVEDDDDDKIDQGMENEVIEPEEN